MPETHTYTLALQDGFDNDTVIVSIAGEVIERIDHVSTRTQIGLARELKVRVPADAAALTIALPTKGIERDIELEDQRGNHLAVSVDAAAGGMSVRQSIEPFGYV